MGHLVHNWHGKNTSLEKLLVTQCNEMKWNHHKVNLPRNQVTGVSSALYILLKIRSTILRPPFSAIFAAGLS